MIIPGFPMPLAMKTGVPYLPIPAMTSNTTPAGWEAFASNENSSSYAAWLAFDRVLGGTYYWHNGQVGPPSHIGLHAPTALTVLEYSISVATQGQYVPPDFQFQGSNDRGDTWNILDTRAGIPWGNGDTRQFLVSDPGAYSSYRVLFTGHTPFGRVTVDEIELLQEDDLP